MSKNDSSFNDLEKELKVKDASCSGSGAARRCQYTHKGLFESTQRWYQIYAMNSVDESPVSETRSGMTAKGDIPEAPQNLRVGVTTAGEMRLYWDRPATPPVEDATHNPPGAPITGYYIVGGPVADDFVPVADDNVANTANDGLVFVEPNAEPSPEDAEDNRVLVAAVDIDTSDGAPSLDYVVFHSQGTERALNTGTVGELATLAQLVGRPSPGHETPLLQTHWGFQAMAVNRVVERNVENGRKIEIAGTTPDGNWSASIRVNDTANQVGMLERPTVEADRHAASNNGRTGIQLDWEVPGSPDTTEYRVEYSEDRIDWKALTGEPPAVFAGFDEGAFASAEAVGAMAKSGVHQNIVAGTNYDYRVFAEQPDPVGDPGAVGAPKGSILTQSSAAERETTATPDRPNTPDLGKPSPVSETVLKMTVLVLEAEPNNEDPDVIGAESGDKEVGFGKLVGYRIEISDDGRDWSKYKPVEIGPKRDVRYSYSEKDMKLTETKASPAPTDSTGEVQFRYTGLHQKATRHFRASTINNAPGTLKYSVATDPMVGTTNESAASDDPGGLVAKAKGRNNIELVWYARGDHITAAPVTGYKIESSPLDSMGDCAEDWTVLMADTMSTATSYPYSGLMPSSGYCYRVFGINVVDVSTSFIGFGDDYASTYDADAQAMTDPAVVPGMPMNVTATATSDTEITVTWGSPADNGGADITGYMVESAYMMADDTMSEWMDVDPAYSGMMMEYMDTGLMPMTKYYYRVSAMNSVGTGMMSDGMADATTDRTNTDPEAVGSIDAQTVTAGESKAVDVSANFSDADDDDLTITATSSNMAVATVAVNGSMVTISGVAEGMATITVTATDNRRCDGYARHHGYRRSGGHGADRPVGSCGVDPSWHPERQHRLGHDFDPEC